MSEFINLTDYASELLEIQNSNIESNTALLSVNPDVESYFEIDANTREILVPSQFEYIGVYNDHNAETVYFRMNRYFDNVDLSQKVCVVLFINPDGIASYSTTTVSENENLLTIGWTINHEHTSNSGILTFAVCFYHINETLYEIDYRWSTKPATVKILPGLDLVKGDFAGMGYDDLSAVLQMIETEKVEREEADDILSTNKADKTALNSKADKEYNSGFVGGKNAKLNAVGGAAIGQNSQASSGGAVGNGTQASEGGAIGNDAYTSHGGSAGKGTYSMHGGAVGRNAKTLHGVAVGDGAQTVDADGNAITAIQLGTGTNTEEGTARFFDYTMMNVDGTIPKERTPDTINRYNVSELPSKSVTYDFSDGVSRFTAVERMTVSVEDGVQVITSGSNAGNKYGLAHFDFGSVSDNATRLIIDYDTKYDGGRWDIGLVDLSKRPGTSDKTTYDDTGVAYRAGSRDGTNYWINGTNKYDTSLNDVWVHTHVDIDTSEGTLKYEVSVDETLKYTDEISIPDSVEKVDGIEIYTWTTETMYIDNIAIKALYNVDENGMYVTPNCEYIYRDGEPVKLGGEVDLSGYYTKTETDAEINAITQIVNGFSEDCLLIHELEKERYVYTISAVWEPIAGGGVEVSLNVEPMSILHNGKCYSNGDTSTGLVNIDLNENLYAYFKINGDKFEPFISETIDDAIDGIFIGTFNCVSSEKVTFTYSDNLNFISDEQNTPILVAMNLAKDAKSTIIAKQYYDNTIILNDNIEVRYVQPLSSLTLTLPTNITNGSISFLDDYVSSVVFTSETTSTNLIYPDTIYMIGTDCIDGIFTPVANKRYTVMVSYDGEGLIGTVGGYPV